MDAKLCDGADRLWLHDLGAMIMNPLMNLSPEALEEPGLVDNIVFGSGVSRVISKALEFCFKGEVDVKGKLLKCWSSVRKALKQDIISDQVIEQTNTQTQQHRQPMRDVCWRGALP